MSKKLASTSFLEKDVNQKAEEIESIAKCNIIDQNKKESATSDKMDDNYWNKYGHTEDSANVEEANNKSEDDVAINYMAVSDTDYEKLTLSPKSSLVTASTPKNYNTSSDRSGKSRSAIKTFASGFDGPTGIVRDEYGNFYVANYSENVIYRVSPDGQKTVFASSDDINGPLGLAIDQRGNIYVANYLSNSIAIINKSGDTHTIVTGLNKPYFLYLDEAESLYVSEQDSNTISVINLNKGKFR